jgi:hypothetical protein
LKKCVIPTPLTPLDVTRSVPSEGSRWELAVNGFDGLESGHGETGRAIVGPQGGGWIRLG